jgi:signal transduction histidine kinase
MMEAPSNELLAQLHKLVGAANPELPEFVASLDHALHQKSREKVRAVGQLAAGMAHEINTPIQFLGDSLAFLAEAFTELEAVLAATPQIENYEVAFLRDQIPSALARCNGGLARVATVVRALEAMAHRDPGEPQLENIGLALEGIVAMVSEELAPVAEVILDLQSQTQVICYAGEIQRALTNVILNAVQAIREREARGVIRIVTRDEGDDLVVTIADDGVGVPEEIRPRIFEPFFTTRPGGTGQGLPVAYTLIVDRHRGSIELDSELGRGTTVTVRLPIHGHPTVLARGSRQLRKI